MVSTTSSPTGFLPSPAPHDMGAASAAGDHNTASATSNGALGYFNFDTPSNSTRFSQSSINNMTQSNKLNLNKGGVSCNIPNIPNLTITLSPPNHSTARLRTKSPTYCSTPGGSKFFDVMSLGVLPIKTKDEFEKLSMEVDDGKYTDVVIVDLRPFSAYNTSRIKNALSICIPSTLLKRPSFTIANISKTMIASQQEELDSKLESLNDLRLIFYDANSKENHCSFQLYQIIKKFHDTLADYDKDVKLYFLNGGFEMFKADKSLDGTFVDANKFRASKSPDTCSFSSFSLPSADPSSSFLMAVKSNKYVIPSDVTNDMKLNIPHFKCIDHLPTWLKKYTEPDSIKTIISNFIKIENTENQRISASVQRRLSVSSGKSSPNSGPSSSIGSVMSPGGRYLFNGSENGFKNRYPNILPYEHSRVKLVPSPMSSANTPSSVNQNFYFYPSEGTTVEPGLVRSRSTQGTRKYALFGQDDYFNANFVNVPQINRSTNYIATQAPLPSTIDDFWKVVWQNHTEVIMSLTNLNENGVKKSDVYWNDSDQIKLLEEIEEFDGIKNLTVRKILMSRREKTRVVYQLHYTNWPDHGVIEDHSDLIRLIRAKEKFVTNKDSPVLVHCSAGCGRTGTFITIDLILLALKQKIAEKQENLHVAFNEGEFPLDGGSVESVLTTEEDLVYFTVQQLRKQRISMVQSLDQFILCYETILFYFYLLETTQS